MTTVTVNDTTTAPTPSQQIVADANRIIDAKDTKGRVISIKRPDMAAEIRIAKAISPENAVKERYYQMVTLASWVVKIDGEPISPCRTELQFDALLERLGGEGFTAVIKSLTEEFSNEAATDSKN